MDLLKRIITNDATAIGTEIIKVDSFLNQQLDIGLLMAIGKEIQHRFAHLGINKILTIEASGIGIAVIAAIYLDLAPVVFAKKANPETITENHYSVEIQSFKKNSFSMAYIEKAYLNKNDHVLILNDFLASGETALGLCSLAEQAGAAVCGVASVIEKEFQGGSTKLREAGHCVQSLAIITKIENGTIYFKN